MKAVALARAGAWLAGAWAGVMLGIGGIAAPTLFQLLPRAEAGRIAGRLCCRGTPSSEESRAGMVLVGLQLGRDRAERGGSSRFGVELMLALGAVGCIVAGHYALLPMLDAARAGQGSLSFGALHALSSGFFVLRLALVATLAWRLTAPPPG